MEPVTWDLTIEWEVIPSTESCQIAGVLPLTADGPSTIVLTCGIGEVLLLSGADGGVIGSAVSDIGINHHSGAVAFPEVGADAIVSFEDDVSGGGLSFVTMADGLPHHLPLESDQDIYVPTALVDLDRDGRAEIVSNVGAVTLDGATHATWYEYYPPGEGYPLVADLHQDGRLWIVNKSGIWSTEDGEGQSWPMDAEWRYDVAAFQKVALFHFDAPVLGLEMNLNFRLIDVDLNTLWTIPIRADPNSGGQADVSAGDANGDGAPDICLPTENGLLLLSLDGEVEQTWARDERNRVAGGCTLVDLDADGVYEVLDFGYLDGLWVLDGRDGAVLASDPGFTRSAINGAPIVADLDGDGSAEILVQGGEANTLLRSYGPSSGRWARTRRVWHQRSYDITSISDEGTILTWPFPSWEAYNAFRAQPAHDGNHPDLGVLAPWACADVCVDGLPQGTVYVAAQVHNSGSSDAPSPVTVRLSVWDPEAPVPALSEVASQVLTEPVPAMRTVSGVLLEVPAESWTGYQVLQVDGSHPDECDRVNDRVELRLDPCG